METKNIIQALIDIHNKLVEISVHGDDTIRMADALQRCRALVFQMQSESEGQNEE